MVLEESSPLFRQGVQVYEIKVMCKELYLAYNSTFLYDICIVYVVFARSVYFLHLLGCKACLFYWKITLTVWGAVVYKSSCFVYSGQKSIHILDYSLNLHYFGLKLIK